MPKYEYRVVAAPTRGVKAKGIKSAEGRFSNALEQLMNAMASEGWEYQRAETLPSTERSGFTSSTSTWRNVLVFRKEVIEDETTPETPVVIAEEPTSEDTMPEEPEAPTELPEIVSPETPDDDASQSEGASRMPRDNGVEDLSEVSGMTNSLKQLAESRNQSKSDD